MAFEKEVEYSGEKKIDTLNSRVRIEQAKNRIVIVNELGVEVLIIDENGIIMNDGSNDRLLIGRQDGGF